MEISVIVPCFNKSATIKRDLAKIHSFLSLNYKSFEIILVDDGSTDDTLKLLSSMKVPQLHIISYYRRRGTGYAIRRGIFASNGENIVCINDIEEFSPVFIKACVNSLKFCDIALGSRYLYNNKSYKNQAPKGLMSRFYNFAVRILLKIKTTDFEAGLKGFKTEPAREVFARQELHKIGFELEMLKYAKQHNYNIVEFPVKTITNVKSNYSFKDFLAMLVSILKLTRHSKRKSQLQEKRLLVCQ